MPKASEEQRLDLINAQQRLRAWLSKIRNDNAKGEFYLTDVVALAVKDRLKVATVTAASADEVEGANDRLQLARMERRYQAAQAQALLRAGLTLADPSRFDLRGTLVHGRDVVVDVGCVFEGRVELGDGVHIGPYCVLRDVRIGAGSIVDAHSVLENAVAGRDCRIGPFARLRPQAQLADEVHVGNFVEVKNATLGKGAKANHLTYLGDAEVGEGANVGAGTITCNYDGYGKHRTLIGAGAFIGSNSALVAPVKIGDNAIVAAGSTVTKDTPADALALARAGQVNRPGWAAKFRRLKSKTKKDG